MTASLLRRLCSVAVLLQQRVLKDAKMGKGEVHDVVLVGGSTRIPKVQQMLQVSLGV